MKTPHEKALGNVLKGKNIEGNKTGHAHKWVAQMGPGPSHACESCGKGKNVKGQNIYED